MGSILAAGQLLAGACDVVENEAIRNMVVRGRAMTPWPEICFTAAHVKYGFIAAGGLYGLAMVSRWLLFR
jgi:hypothetical protein